MNYKKDNKNRWIKFKKWCFKYYRNLAICMMIILIIIGIWFNPFENNNIILKYKQIGGGGKSDDLESKDATNSEQLLNNTSSKNIESGGKSSKYKTGALQVEEKMTGGKSSNYIMNKFSNNSSVIYEIFYQIAFIIIILLIVFPTIALFIIAMICFIILRNKLTYIKSL